MAFVDGTPVGSVSLIEHNMDTRRDLTPWLAALFVLPPYRGRGIGTSLIERCESEAKAAGFDRMYLYASDARDYYPRFGWTVIANDRYEGEAVVIMAKDLH